MPKLYCYSMVDFNAMCAMHGWDDKNCPPECAFISILSTPGVAEYKTFRHHFSHFREPHENVIVQRFDDISCDHIDYEMEGYKFTAHCITDEQAREMALFIDKHAGKDIYVHCMAGMSRSQGVVRYILDTYRHIYTTESLNPNNPCLYPNIQVKSQLNKALRELIDENLVQIHE